MSYVGRATTNVSRGGVFISYARSDGEEFAGRLRERLEAEGVRLWQDRVGMEGGRDWWLQITEALDRVEFMVLLMTPAAMRSEVVRKEWRYARRQGVCVYPVKTSRDLDFGSLPRWMRDMHFYDVGTLEDGVAAGPEWAKFLKDLRSHCQVPRVPFMVEDLPKDFVERPGEFDKLIGLLLDGAREEAVAITAALRGAGGYGKTTLARALCHDERAQDAFDDGVLWVTLGETPGDLTGRVEDLIYTLSDERPGFTGIDAATAHLAELLADRDILVVIDDVWNGEHLRPFMQGGPRCARLVTTRNADTLPSNARNVDVDAMRQDEAVALLGSGLSEGHDVDLCGLAKRLGEWPLLLKLVNGTLRERVNQSRQRLADAVTYVNKALDKKGLTFFDARNPAARTQAVSMTLGVSLEQLDEAERARYGELAVFPEDADVPLATLEKFWGLTGGLDDLDTEALCERLHRFSLLLNFDPAAHTVRLHDVIRAYLIQQQQGEGLAALHARLLDAHRPKPAGAHAPAADWAALPAEEPYLWDYLAYHLKEAGRGDELLATVKDLRFLANKTFARDPVAAEGDLAAAEELYPEDAALNLLRRSYARFGHLFARHENANDLAAALFSRLQHLDALAPLTRELERELTPPYLAPFHRLPDLSHPALIRTLQGHESEVEDCAISPDSSRIVSASLDGTLKVWGAKNGAVLHTLAGHGDKVRGCAFSPDGTFIVSASSDRTLKVWDAESGKERLTLAGHTGVVNACAVSAGGQYIVSASDDGTLKIWEAQSGNVLHTLSGHRGSVYHCAFSPDGSFVASVAGDGPLKVWDVATGHERFTVGRDGRWITAFAISPDGSRIVASRLWQNGVTIWNALDGSELGALMVEGLSGSSACAFSPDGAFIVFSTSGGIGVCDAKTGTLRQLLTGHTSPVKSCAVSPDGSFIVSASGDWTLRLWDARNVDTAPPVTKQVKYFDSCAVSPDGSEVFIASLGSLRKWDAEGGGELGTVAGTPRMAECILSWDCSVVGYALWEGGLLAVHATADGRRLCTLSGHTSRVTDCAFSYDGSFIVSASGDKTLIIWDARSGEERLTLAGHAYSVVSCCITPDDSLVVSASSDGTLKSWDTRDGTLRHTFSRHTNRVIKCVVSPDGALVISASWDETLKVWNLSTGKELRTLAGHKSLLKSCAMSPNGLLLASVSFSGELKIWDALQWNCLTSLYVDGHLSDCAWFPDNRRLVAVGSGGVYFLRLAL